MALQPAPAQNGWPADISTAYHVRAHSDTVQARETPHTYARFMAYSLHYLLPVTFPSQQRFNIGSLLQKCVPPCAAAG